MLEAGEAFLLRGRNDLTISNQSCSRVMVVSADTQDVHARTLPGIGPTIPSTASRTLIASTQVVDRYLAQLFPRPVRWCGRYQ